MQQLIYNIINWLTNIAYYVWAYLLHKERIYYYKIHNKAKDDDY